MGLTSRLKAVYAWPETRPTLTRWILAGPVALFVSVFSMATLPLVLPPGAAAVNNLALPVVLFPLFWAVATLAPVIAGSLGLTAAVMLGILGIEVLIIILAFV